MSILERMKSLRRLLCNLSDGGHKEKSSVSVDFSSVDLRGGIDKFLDWYSENGINSNGFGGNLDFSREEMEHFIEKMAVWYELRYSDYDILDMMVDDNKESLLSDKVLFRNNPYLNGNDSLVTLFDWRDFYNKDAFIRTLSEKEQQLLMAPTSNYYFSVNGTMFYLDDAGKVIGTRNLQDLDSSFSDEDFIGKHVVEILSQFNKKGIKLPRNNDLSKNTADYNNALLQREKLLHSIMLKILERGGKRLGVYRALLFAKEFGTNIDIPMMYAPTFSDYYLKKTVELYRALGGNENLMCCDNYFNRSKSQKIEMVSLKELYIKVLVKEESKRQVQAFLDEEEQNAREKQNLVERLAGDLSLLIDDKELSRQKRIERKRRVAKNN